MGFPGSKVHRRSRRKLGRGQHVAIPACTVTVTDSGSVATLTFSEPVICSAQPAIVISGGVTVSSYAQTSSTVVTLTCSGALVGKTYTLPANVVATVNGGGSVAASGTFS